MSGSSLLDEITNALLSSASSDAVRVWLWLRIVQGGECPLGTLYSRWPNLIRSGVAELVKANLIRIEGNTVRAEPFDQHKAPDISRRPIRRKVQITPTRDTVTPTESEVAKVAKISRRPAPSPSPEPTSPSEAPEAPAPAKPTAESSEHPASALTGRERLREALKAPRAKGSRQAIAEGCEWVFRRYNAARRRHGVRAYSEQQSKRARKHWKAVATYIVEGDHPIDDFMDFAYKRSRWQKNAFPTPAFVAGDWIRDEWESAGDAAGVSSAHAGARYAAGGEDERDVARAIAARHGFAELDDETVDYIIEQAENLRERPHLYSPDPEFAAVERELADNTTA